MPLHLTASQRTVTVEPSGTFDVELFMTETAPPQKLFVDVSDNDSVYDSLDDWRRRFKLSYITSFDDELVYEDDQSIALFRTRPQQGRNGTRSRKLLKESLENERHLSAETTRVGTLTDDGETFEMMPYIMEEERVPPNGDTAPNWYDGAPVHYHFQLSDDIEPGTYEITFLLSYEEGNRSGLDRETVTIEVLDSVERNRKALQYGTLIGGLTAGTAALASTQNVVLTTGLVLIVTLGVLLYLRGG